MLSINVLSLLSIIGRNKTPISKLQKSLIKDEESEYVNHVFTKEKVRDLTTLKGDSLQIFMDAYRPSIQKLKNMTEYDLMLYVKKSFNEFIKTNRYENNQLFKN